MATHTALLIPEELPDGEEENPPLWEAPDFHEHPHGWSRLAKNLRAEIDEELIEAYRGTVSLPFEPGDHRQAAVKIVDDRGIESLKIIPIGDA